MQKKNVTNIFLLKFIGVKCRAVMKNGRNIQLKKGQPKLINRKVNHSFKTKNGCVIEEVSTTHIKGDSIYDDVTINELSLDERKINIKL